MPSSSRRLSVVPVGGAGEQLPVAPVHPFDRRHGTDTGGLLRRAELVTGHRSDAQVTAYYGVAPSILNGLLNLWLRSGPALPIDRYTFLDVGAGKGRGLMIAAQHPFREVNGVELNPALAAIARANLRRFAGSEAAGLLAPVSVVEGDALEVPLPAGACVLFLFHPFEAALLRRFVRRVERHWRGGDLDLLYVNAEHAAVLDASGGFMRIFQGQVAMSPEDHVADLAEIAGQQEYGSTGDELCAIYRLAGTGRGDG